MLSKKCQKYMDQYQEKNYAVKSRKLEKDDLVKHQDRSQCRETAKTSGCHSNVESGKVQEEIKPVKKQRKKRLL